MLLTSLFFLLTACLLLNVSLGMDQQKHSWKFEWNLRLFLISHIKSIISFDNVKTLDTVRRKVLIKTVGTFPVHTTHSESESRSVISDSATPRESHGWRSLVGCSPWGREESDTTERLRFHFSLSCIGEGNGNPLQCSCLENPRDSGAWWAAVYRVAQSRTRLKRQQHQQQTIQSLEFSRPEYWSG